MILLVSFRATRFQGTTCDYFLKHNLILERFVNYEELCVSYSCSKEIAKNPHQNISKQSERKKFYNFQITQDSSENAQSGSLKTTQIPLAVGNKQKMDLDQEVSKSL